MELQRLKQKVHQRKNEIGLVGGSIKIQEYDKAESNVSAHISPKDWNIEVTLRKGFDPVLDRGQKAYARKKGITNGLETLVSDITTHEFAHWQLPYGSQRGCPMDLYNHDKILEAVKEALPEDKRQHAGYVANAFEDMIINPRCREFNGSFSGQVLFWDNEGLSGKERGEKNFTPFYEAFVELNMHLWGDNTDKALLKRHYSSEKVVEEAVSKTVRELGLPENIKDTKELFNTSQWPQMARIFARNLSILLQDSPPQERLSAFSPDGEEGSQGQEEKSGNGLEKRAKTDEGKEEIAYGRYSSGENQSTNLTSYDQLDALYRKLSKDIAVKVEAMSKHQGLAIAPLTYRSFDEERDDPARIKPSKLVITAQGLQFGYPNMPLVIDARHKVQRKSFPDFKMIVLDNSSSMVEGIDGSGSGNTNFIPWGDNSKYHYALLGFWGIESYLKKQGIAQYIQHGLSLFSDTTRFKEGDYSKIDEVRKLALAPEFSRNTYIDAKTLTDALKGRESFVLSLSDGEIGNWGSEKAHFEALVKSNYYAHIQIGGETQFTRDLKDLGVPVFPVNSGEDLSRLMVDVTKKTYGGLVKS